MEDPALKHINKIVRSKTMPQEAKDLAAIANKVSERMLPNKELPIAMQFILCAMEALERGDKIIKKQQAEQK